MDENSRKFWHDYLQNQTLIKTIFSDDSGHFISDKLTMNRGTVQGQIGADVVFVIQSLILKDHPEVYRTSYIDDINDVISNTCPLSVIDTAILNEKALISQSRSIGFCLNPCKTEYVPFNIDLDTLKLKNITPTM